MAEHPEQLTPADMNEPTGTSRCPICGYGEPHHHTADEIAQRPQIDGARVAFERFAQFCLTPFIHLDPEAPKGAINWHNVDWLEGWAARHGPTGDYRLQVVQAAWVFFRAGWVK